MLLQVSSLDNLVNYFQSIYNNVMFEVKGVRIGEVKYSTPHNTACDNSKFN